MENEFGEYLKELRGKRSLREMERVTGISHTYLSTLEKGYDPRSGKERKPTPETLKKLSATLEVSYTDLMKKAGYMKKKTISELIKDLRVKSGLSIEEVSKKTLFENKNGELETVSVDRLLELENGQDKNMSLFEIVSIANAFNVSPSHFVATSDIETPLNVKGKISIVTGTESVEMFEDIKHELLKKATEVDTLNHEKLKMFYDFHAIKNQEIILLNNLKKIAKSVFNRDFEVNVENENLKDDEYLKNFELGNLILFNSDINYKGQHLTVDQRRLLFEKIIEVMEQSEK